MSDNQRQQRFIERIQEDERLRGDLAGATAAALVAWASAQVAAASADPARPDSEIEQAVVNIRSAASQSARSGETEPDKLIALAENLLQHGSEPGQASLAGAQPHIVAPPLPAAPTPDEPLNSMAPARFGRVRYRWGERIRRWLHQDDDLTQ